MKEKKKGLLNTCVFLKLFLEEEDKEIVRKLLYNVITKEIDGFVSVVTISELVTICIRDKKEALIPTIIEFIIRNFTIIDTTPDIAVLSGYFKAKYSKGKKKLSYADSVILACAFVYGCTLVSYDSEFEGIKEVEILKSDKFLEQLNDSKD